MDDAVKAESVKLFLRTSRVPDTDNVFAIGPFGSRVSFAAQQKRAFNTVWALEKETLIRPGSKVAVLGAGIAGLTAAAALASRRCIVHLFEKSDRELRLQKETVHRYIHPTVNLWPDVAVINPTTVFPFMDWHADQCSRAVDALYREWKDHLKKYVTKTYLRSLVLGLDPPNKPKFVICSPGGEADERSGPYDVIILALGFGPEREVSGLQTTSYWTRDAIADLEGESDTKSVSGIGDGGLIDALRIVHTNFDMGKLPLAVVHALDNTGIPEHLRALERAIRDRATSNEVAAPEYAERYNEAFELIPPYVLELLDNSLRTDLNEPLLLIGALSAPYSLTSAPIHKLMITHAIARNAVRYEMGRLTNGPVLTVAGTPTPLPTPCVVRHGPDAEKSMSGLLSPSQATKLRANQTVLEDVLEMGQYDGSYWARWPGYPQQSADSPAFVDFRFPAAKDYVLREFEVPLSRAYKGGKASYFVTNPPGQDLSRMVPKKLFGITTDVRPGKIQHV